MDRIDRRALSLALWFCLLAAAVSGAAGEKKWDVNDPGLPSDTLAFATAEGTWISLDVHPDGKRIAFDLLGDIYDVPIEGGDARLLSGGMAYEVQPRWSPDGERILFTSDRGGGDNIWTMDANGGDRVQATKESYRLLNNGSWHPDGEYLVARKHFTSQRSLGAGEMWLYRLPEGGEGVQLTKRKNDQQDAGEPVFSPDGRHLYWSEDMSGGSSFEYNKDPNRSIYVIRRLEMDTGEIRDLIRLPGGAARPQPSPDGKSLAFVRRVREKTVLALFDLETGEVRHLWDGLSEDQQETWAIFGVYPGFDWTPDGRSIVIWAQGGIWRVDAGSGQATQIPFRARVEQTVARALRVSQHVGGDSFPVRAIRWPTLSPNGKTAVFQALGQLYRRKLDGGEPERITKQKAEFEFAPALSADGRRVVFVTWSDGEGGRVRSVELNGKGARTIVERPGHYASAAFSPDGEWIVYQRGGGDTYRGHLWIEEPGIYLIDASGKGEPRFLTREGSRPVFAPGGERILLQSHEGDAAALVSVDLQGKDRRVLASSEFAIDFQLSPDGAWLAFEELSQVHLIPFPPAPAPLAVSAGIGAVPARQLSEVGGSSLGWSADSRRLTWSLGPELFALELADLEWKTAEKAEADSSETEAPRVPARSIALGWDAPADVPGTDLYLVGGRILTMVGDAPDVVADGVIHVVGNRIAAIGGRRDVAVPEGAQVIDVSGKTVMPGFVDVHAHTGSSNLRVQAQRKWAYLANLAFGVTTTHDPSNDTEMIFASAELVEFGRILGPRVFSTGGILYGADGSWKTVIDDYEDALHAVARRKAWGAFTVKSYNQPRREQRQMVMKAGRELDVMVVPEGGSTLHHNMTMLLDGHTTLEHAIPVAPLYEPELRLLGRFGTAYTPTLIVGYGGLWGENYWYQHDEVWKNERLMNFVPRSVVDPRARRRTMAADEEYHHFALARTAAEVLRRGGNVEIGAHGQIQGLGVHWELWMFAQGGMSNYQALRAGTWMGARAIGLDGELGSLAPGLLADLIVIDGDPLQDIRDSEKVAFTMINGRFFDAMTLEQIHPERRRLPEGPYLEASLIDMSGFDCLRP